MQISKVHNSSVEIKFLVVIPAEDIEKRINEWIDKKSETLKLDGFRKGKVPKHIAIKNYVDQAESFAIDNAIQDYVKKILDDEKLAPASTPLYQVTAYERGKDLSFSLIVEQAPSFDLMNMKDVTINTVQCDLTQEEIDKSFNEFCANFQRPIPVQRDAQNGDIVNFACTVVHKGQIIDDLCHKNITVCVGGSYDEQNNFIKHMAAVVFEGKSLGSSVTQSIRVPKIKKFGKYADKKVELTFEITEISSMSQSELDDAGLKWLGFNDIDSFKKHLEEQLRKEHQKKINLLRKRSILDTLSELYSFDVPKSIVDKDFNEIWKYVSAELKEARSVDDADVRGKTDEEIANEYRDIAKRRVRLGYVISKVIEAEKLSVTSDRLKMAVEEELSNYPLEQDRILTFYSQNPEALKKFYPTVLEDLAVEHLLKNANVVEKNIAFNEFTELWNTME
ncbi:MAG: trigger factor [Holosporales bacterium]|jgi:trigger factor|nr:trigger factor [Holosporales bacterium]